MPVAEPLNKTMDRADLDTAAARVVVDELNDLIGSLSARGVRISSWYGAFELSDDPGSWERVNRGYDYRPLDGAADDHLFPWFLYWEIAWLVTNNRFEKGQRLLDLGGCSSLFSIYMASKGLEVTAIDLDDELVMNGNRVAATTGWALRNARQDIAKLDLAETFDHVTSVCVFEHVPLSTRVRAGDQVRRLLRPGGTFSMTFDYLNPSRLAAIDSPDDVQEQFVRPSGLRVRGNARFVDNGKRYLLHPSHHPSAASSGWHDVSIEAGQFEPADAREVSRSNEYTFGALFLERP
jgi:2-polyprenyl-3-methyl-5-hydroxy-6-metoxy-1,4-benzoquinol methylase